MANKTILAFGIISIVLTMLTVIFDTRLGIIFTGMLAFAMFYYGMDRSRRFELEKRQNRTKSLIFAGIGYLILEMFINFLAAKFQLKAASLFDFGNSLLFSEINPALSGNSLLSVVTIGIIVPFIETMWLAIVLEFLFDQSNHAPNLKSSKTWGIVLLITSIYTILHFTALGVTNTASLVVVAAFSIISLLMIIIEGQMLGSILLHVMANTRSLISLGKFSSLFASQGLMIIAVGILAYLLFTHKSIKSVFSAG